MPFHLLQQNHHTSAAINSGTDLYIKPNSAVIFMQNRILIFNEYSLDTF